ncbi:MAG: hypothetical protein ACI93V_000911 [Alteromonadaceae bacterium]|jgi:hypothetical protein
MVNTEKTIVGLGCPDYQVAVYIGNRPPLYQYQTLDQFIGVCSGEINAIGQQCGNGWRKVFNVYAKLLYALDIERFSFTKCAPSWQQYRDCVLLQTASKTALLFNAPFLDNKSNNTRKIIHLIIGKTYAKSLVKATQLECELTWLDNEFAINTQHRVIVCPYFDYRQLSNIKIERLAAMMKGL